MSMLAFISKYHCALVQPYNVASMAGEYLKDAIKRYVAIIQNKQLLEIMKLIRNVLFI